MLTQEMQLLIELEHPHRLVEQKRELSNLTVALIFNLIMVLQSSKQPAVCVFLLIVIAFTIALPTDREKTVVSISFWTN